MRGAPALSPQTTALSIFVVASILLGRRIAPRFPVSLVVVVGTIAATELMTAILTRAAGK